MLLEYPRPEIIQINSWHRTIHNNNINKMKLFWKRWKNQFISVLGWVTFLFNLSPIITSCRNVVLQVDASDIYIAKYISWLLIQGILFQWWTLDLCIGLIMQRQNVFVHTLLGICIVHTMIHVCTSLSYICAVILEHRILVKIVWWFLNMLV